MKPKACSPVLLASSCLAFPLQGWPGEYIQRMIERFEEISWGLHLTVEVMKTYLASAGCKKATIRGQDFGRPREMASLTGAGLGQLQCSAVSQPSEFRVLCNHFVSLAEFLKTHSTPCGALWASTQKLKDTERKKKRASSRLPNR